MDFFKASFALQGRWIRAIARRRWDYYREGGTPPLHSNTNRVRFNKQYFYANPLRRDKSRHAHPSGEALNTVKAEAPKLIISAPLFWSFFAYFFFKKKYGFQKKQDRRFAWQNEMMGGIIFTIITLI